MHQSGAASMAYKGVNLITIEAQAHVCMQPLHWIQIICCWRDNHAFILVVALLLTTSLVGLLFPTFYLCLHWMKPA